MPPLLASLFDGLDGVMYFFVSSGIFVLVTAVLFFSLGLWIGALTWGRFKRRFRAGQETIEDLKNELALLKRRTAELASRGLPHQQGQARSGPRSALAALVHSVTNPPPTTPPPPGAGFTIWTEAGWAPRDPAEHARQQRSRKLPRSHAFTIWTEHRGKSHPPRILSWPPSAAFSVWTEAGFEPTAPVAARSSQSSVVGGAASNVKTVPGFPKAGAAVPTFGDWLHSRAARSGNGEPLPPRPSISPAEAFRSELNGGLVRNDFLLGIVFNAPPEPCDDLSKLDGISGREREALEAYGVHRFKQIAFWDDDQAEEFARRLGLKDRGRAIRWIGQAARLIQASGGAPS
jgi:hypothetical protein